MFLNIIDFLNYFVVKKYFFYFQYVNVIRYFVQKYLYIEFKKKETNISVDVDEN